jgi:hypothetical protein
VGEGGIDGEACSRDGGLLARVASWSMIPQKIFELESRDQKQTIDCQMNLVFQVKIQ